MSSKHGGAKKEKYISKPSQELKKERKNDSTLVYRQEISGTHYSIRMITGIRQLRRHGD